MAAPKLIFRTPSEFFKIAPLTLQFLLVLIDLPILICGLILAALQLVADQRSCAQS